MILVDTSVWIDHLRANDENLTRLLNAGQILSHPFVIGELALGNLRQRDIILDALDNLPKADIATDQEVLRFINQHALFGLGIGYIDAHLLVSARLTVGGSIWTWDKRLLGVADSFGLAVQIY